MSHHVADDGAPDEGEVSEEVERLVPHELVGEPKLAVLDAVLSDDDAVARVGPACEAVGLERPYRRSEGRAGACVSCRRRG
jgi:hypothetical protein